ncbi:MAG TPA: hypothetical protein EYP29_03295, partial [Thermoplasmata archaeon]|nr:hypothetical protein [Thermoplasmata archaeon]
MVKKVTTCSELERFGYCPLSWWLSRKGVQGKGKELQEGIEKHKVLEEGLSVITKEDSVSDQAKKGIFGYTAVTVILALTGILIIKQWIFGIPADENSAAIFIILSLI